jgi:hypothetical protein
MKLVIIGNGFDLHHGYKTSFSNFREHLLNSSNESDQQLILDVDTVLKSQNINLKENILWNDFERIIGRMVESNPTLKVENILISSLTEEFTKRFFHYLNEELIGDFKENKKILNEINGSDSILTFNYTNFYSKYLNNKEIDVCHIHGELVEDNLPLIGFFYNLNIINSYDYMIRYRNKFFDKGALGYKQNEYDLEDRIKNYIKKWDKKISEVVIIGYSFGESDSHIYRILNSVLLGQNQDVNIPLSRAKDIPIIKFKLYNYNSLETNNLLEKLQKSLIQKANRRSFVNVTGKGFTPEKKDIIKFEVVDY